MTIRKLILSILSLALPLWLLFSLVTPSSADRPNNPQPRAYAIQGLTKVDGKDVVVEILVAVAPGENASEKAKAVLRRAYPDARPIDSAEYSLTGLDWNQFSDGDPANDFVSVYYNQDGVPGNLNNHRIHWLTSMTTWTNVSTSSFVYRDAGDTGRCPSLVRECPGPQRFDGNNDVGWLNINDPSVLGVTWFGTSTDEFDMALDNQDFTWYTGDPSGIPGNAIDTETVWLHEFGHGLGLGHSTVNGAIMEPYYEGVRRTLHQDDIDGVSFLYPDAGGPTPTPTPTPTPSSTPTPTPTPAEGFTLSASGYKVKGVQHADLNWSGAASANVDIFRNAALVTTTSNDGFHTDNIDKKGGGTYVYQVCEASTSTCSNEATVIF